MKNLIYAVGLLCLAMSFVLLTAMGLDKRRARADRRRVPERTLFLLALLFGAPGGLLGMYAFRHKTKHWYFRYGLPAILIVEIGLFVWLAGRYL